MTGDSGPQLPPSKFTAGYTTGDGVDGGAQWDAQYVDFARLGDRTNNAIQHALHSANQIFRIEHATFESCGAIGSTQGSAIPAMRTSESVTQACFAAS